MLIRRALRQATNPFLSLVHRAEWRGIEARRTALLASMELIEDVDYGAGDPKEQRAPDVQNSGVAGIARISDFAGYSKPPMLCRVLYHLTRLKEPNTVLELGTCVGISAAYLATALKQNGQGHLWTIEGSPKIADIAFETLAALGLSDFASVVRGPFHQMLVPLQTDRKFDFVFIDGHHDGAATVAYFEQIKPHLQHGALILFDDIEWSTGMADAWRTIRGDAAFAETVSSSGLGFCSVA